jgi:sulfur-carrier protein
VASLPLDEEKLLAYCRSAAVWFVLGTDVWSDASGRASPVPKGASNGARSMPRVVFTPNIQRHVLCPEASACGHTVREVLDGVFAENAQARSYVLDDQAGLRKHMTIFVDGRMIRDRIHLSDPVGETSTVYVLQALSGG